MKRGAVLLFPSVLSLLSFAACSGSSKSEGGGDLDAGGADSSVRTDRTDGAPTDSGPSGPPGPSGPSTTATVVVTKAGAPDPDVDVVFQDTTGAVTSAAVTGADGKATGTVAAGAQVTVALGASGGRHVITYVGVKPGDVLNVVERSSRDVNITQTTTNDPGGSPTIVAGSFACSTNAESTGTPVLIGLTAECITGAVFPVVSLLDFNDLRYFSYRKGITPVASGTTNVAGLSPWAQGTPFTLNVTNVPTTGSANAYLGQIADNQSITLGSETPFNLVAGAGTGTFSVATGYADAYQGEVQLWSYGGPNIYVTTFAKRVPTGTATQALDLAAGLLPNLLTATVTNAETARPVITWTSSAALDTTDGGVVGLVWSHGIDGGFETVDWTFIVPPGTLTVKAPQLPAALAAFAPVAGATLQAPTVGFFETDLLMGYDAVRAQAAAFGLDRVPLPAFGTYIATPALPAAGTLRITAIAPGAS